MTALPSGTITFLFTDIEGSTRLWEQHPEAMKQALARHDGLLRQAIERHEGYVFKRMGDAFCAAFHTAPEALAATLNAQRALHAELWSETGPIRVRMALHTGVTEQRDGDYFGPVLNRVARLLSAGHGGQVLLSAATQELVRDHLPEGVTLRDLGQRRLRDLTRPEQIYQLEAPDLPAEFAPLKTLEQRRTNLPVQPTALIGRERELAQLSALLRQEDVRLVTLTGFGGTGKTRLALQLAAELLDDYPDGIFFVDLAPIHDPQLVVPAIAQVVGVREQGQAPLLQLLQDELRSRRLLLLLDNFEQVVAAAPVVAELLQAAPSVKLLVTSRVVLRVRGEQEYPVPPLALPDLQQLPPLGRLTQYEAVRLFIERAGNVQPDFAVTNATAPAIAEICHRLDGLPLAIELAAARMRILLPEQLLQRLDQRLRLLTGGARDLPPRQQTLRSTIEWSYQLLDEPQQRLFRRLGVFVGGCTLEAAEAVCNTEADLGLEVLDGLDALVERSLLRQQVLASGEAAEPRFWMLETLREYALEQLEQRGEAAALRDQHLRYFLAFAEQAAPHGRDTAGHFFDFAALKRLTRVHDNLRAALGWAAQQPDVEPWLHLVGALLPFWQLTAPAEGLRWARAAIAAGSYLGPCISLGRALLCLGFLEWMQGDRRTGRTQLHAALDIFQQQGDGLRCSFVWDALGLLAATEGNAAQARAYFTSALSGARALGLRRLSAMVLFHLGDVLLPADPSAARSAYEESLQILREEAEDYNASFTLTSLGRLELQQGNAEQAYRHIAEGLEIRRRFGKNWILAISLNSLGDVARAGGDAQQAEALYQEALALGRELDHRASIAWSLYNLGALALGHGAATEAAARFAASLALEQEQGNMPGIARCLAGLVGVAAIQGRAAPAARLAGAVEALLERMATALEPWEQRAYAAQRASVQRQLAAEAWAAAWAAGQAMALDEAIANALEWLKERD